MDKEMTTTDVPLDGFAGACRGPRVCARRREAAALPAAAWG